MTKRSMGLTVFGYGLITVYSLGLIAAFLLLGNAANIATLWILFLPQIVALVGVLKLQQWGRRLVIAMNAAACLYTVWWMFIAPRAISLSAVSSIFIFVAIILFFNTNRIKKQFDNWSGSSNKTILVVDDDKGFVKMLKVKLSAKGFNVLTAFSGEQGLQVAKRRLPNLIILDVIMPGMKGRKVCALLKDDPQTKNIPVVFLTAKDSPDDVKAEMEAGAVTHFTKPINSEKLADEIRKILGM